MIKVVNFTVAPHTVADLLTEASLAPGEYRVHFTNVGGVIVNSLTDTSKTFNIPTDGWSVDLHGDSLFIYNSSSSSNSTVMALVTSLPAPTEGPISATFNY